MKVVEPINQTEKKLVEKENWVLAEKLHSYWHENIINCDLCNQKINGRHMIDGKRKGLIEFAVMCPVCYKRYGEGFGEGQGQL